MGDNEKAIDQYGSALAKHPSIVGTRARLVSSLHNNLGMVLVRVGREAEGIAHFRKALEIFPRSVNAHLNLGNLAFDNGRYVDALAEYQAAQALNPGNPAVEQRVESARQSIQKALLDNKAPPPSP
jgi:tetratricopeptide (TPR) repeat protein